MIFSQLRKQVSLKRLLRVLLILAGAWLLLGLLLRAWLSPILGWGTYTDVEAAQMMGINWSEMAQVRADAEAYFRQHKSWPKQARTLYRVDDNGLIRIDMPEAMVLRFGMSYGLPEESGLRNTRLRMRFDAASGRWQCENDTPPVPRRWLRSECLPVASAWTLGHRLFAGFLILLAAWITLLALLAFADPRLALLRRQPVQLRRQPIADVPGLHRRLRWLRRLDASLAAAEIAPADWREALAYGQADVDARVQLLALRISARSVRSPGWSLPGQVFEWHLPPSLPIALERALVYLPSPEVSARDLVRHLQGVQTGQDVLLVISNQRSVDTVLTAYASDTANLCVAVDQASQSEWLLHPAPTEVLVALLARQLQFTRISPYQTRGGITRPAAFFGRAQLLARVLNREPGNYLLVGGRQLGKTSLMKAIERRFAEHPRVHCRYLSLRDHRLAARLAAEVQGGRDASIETSILALVRQAGQRRLLLLIDESDLFLREEARTGYSQLSSLRALSEEGHCNFMLAGFWDLYQATTLDFASPIRNFGEVISLGALEPEACIALATEPLQRLGIRFEHPALVHELVSACGYRANLVAIVCQHALQQLARGERLLHATHLQQAMHSEALQDALAGWARLSPEPRACAVDRIIVYRLAQAALVSALAPVQLPELLAGLRAYAIDAEMLRASMLRLQLAYIVRREGEGFVFAVPLFASQFRAQEVDALLTSELDDLRAVAP